MPLDAVAEILQGLLGDFSFHHDSIFGLHHKVHALTAFPPNDNMPDGAASSMEGSAIQNSTSQEASPQYNPAAQDGSTVEQDDANNQEVIVWENTEGLPSVTANTRSNAYLSTDIAEAPGESTFFPLFGCKCGEWGPAPVHPEIRFRPELLLNHPDFLSRVGALKVHMEDITTQPSTVHWDAQYNIRRFVSKADAAQGFLQLEQTLPPVPGSGSRMRFMTFCPPEGGGPHQYNLTVTALDMRGNPIEYFRDEKTTYTATPPSPEQPQQPLDQSAADQALQSQMQ